MKLRYSSELYHHGVKGMKWGVRRYQQEDGTRTDLGKKHENQLQNGQKPTAKVKVKSKKETAKFNRSVIKGTNDFTKDIVKDGAKRAAIGAAVGTIGAYAVGKLTNNKRNAQIVAYLAGAYTASTVVNTAAAAVGVQAVSRMFVGANTVVQNRRRKKYSGG